MKKKKDKINSTLEENNSKKIVFRVIIVILVLILILAGVFATLYFATDMFKSNKQLFMENMGETIKKLQISEEEKSYTEKKKTQPYTNEGEYTNNIMDGDSEYKDINDFTISFSGKTDKPNNKLEQEINLNYDKDNKFQFKYKKVDDKIGLQSDDLTELYTTADEDKLNLIFGDKAQESYDQIKELLEQNQTNSSQNVDSFIKIFDKIDESKFVKKGNNEYELELKGKDIASFVEDIIEYIKQVGAADVSNEQIEEYQQNLVDNLEEQIDDNTTFTIYTKSDGIGISSGIANITISKSKTNDEEKYAIQLEFNLSGLTGGTTSNIDEMESSLEDSENIDETEDESTNETENSTTNSTANETTNSIADEDENETTNSTAETDVEETTDDDETSESSEDTDQRIILNLEVSYKGLSQNKVTEEYQIGMQIGDVETSHTLTNSVAFEDSVDIEDFNDENSQDLTAEDETMISNFVSKVTQKVVETNTELYSAADMHNSIFLIIPYFDCMQISLMNMFSSAMPTGQGDIGLSPGEGEGFVGEASSAEDKELENTAKDRIALALNTAYADYMANSGEGEPFEDLTEEEIEENIITSSGFENVSSTEGKYEVIANKDAEVGEKFIAITWTPPKSVDAEPIEAGLVKAEKDGKTILKIEI